MIRGVAVFWGVLLGAFFLWPAEQANAATQTGAIGEPMSRRSLSAMSDPDMQVSLPDPSMANAPFPSWSGVIPMVMVGPSCRREFDVADDRFDLKFRRGVKLAYASPVTVTDWRNPDGTCQRFHTSLRLHGSRFQFRGFDRIHETLKRVHYQQYVSYVWQYDERNFLQRFEPGVLLFGSVDALPHLRLMVELDLADYFRLRLEHTINLAALEQDAWYANLHYAF